jgi:transposase
MSTRFVNIDRDTPMLLPPDLRDWVQQDDLVHFLVDALHLLDLSVAAVNWRGTGSEQYPPAMMLGLITYCYSNGIFSSRQIERATYQNLSVRYLAANTHPDHDTIAKFRRENTALLRSAFVQLLQLAQRAGLLKLGVIAIDGTKLEANAAKRKTLTVVQLEEELRRLDQRVTELLHCAEIADQSGETHAELPAELADTQQRRARLLQAKAQLERQAQERHARREVQRQERPPGDKPRRVPAAPRPTDTINPTDVDSTLTPTAHQRYLQGYNAQLVVSAEGLGLIVATDVVRDTNDLQQLEPMVEQTVENVGVPEQVLVDTGYENVRQILAVETHHPLTVLCPPAQIANSRPSVVPRSPWRRQRKAKREELRARLQTSEGRARYALRRITVEPVIGIIKNVLGFVRFGMRGLEKVKTEWLWVSLAFNCRRIAARLA